MLLNRRRFLSLLPAPMVVSAAGIMPISAFAFGETTPLGPYFKAVFDILDSADNVVRTGMRICGVGPELKNGALYLMPKEPIPDIVHEYVTGRTRLTMEVHYWGPPMRQVYYEGGSVEQGTATAHFGTTPYFLRID